MSRTLDVPDVLLVDDSDEDAELSLRELRRYRVANRVYRARNGQDALEILFGSKTRDGEAGWKTIRLMLLDVRMPVVSGIELLQQLRAATETASIPIIMLSGTADPRELEQALAMGAQGVLIKPLELSKLTALLQSLAFDIAILNHSPNVSLKAVGDRAADVDKHLKRGK